MERKKEQLLPMQICTQPSLLGPWPWSCFLQPTGISNKAGRKKQQGGEIKEMLRQGYSLQQHCWGKKILAFPEAQCFFSWSNLWSAAREATGNNYRRQQPGTSELLQQRRWHSTICAPISRSSKAILVTTSNPLKLWTLFFPAYSSPYQLIV